MVNFRGLCLLLICIYTLTNCSTPDTTEALKRNIQLELPASRGEFAVAFKNLQTGEEILWNEKTSFHAASTMKTPVLIEVYKQAAEGKFSLKDSITIKNEFKSIVDSSAYSLSADDDSEQELYKQVGLKTTLDSLVYKMIIVSSNLATNMIIDLVDAKKVTQTMRDMGAKDIQVLRGVEDDKAFEKGLSNTTTAHDLMLIFEKIANGTAVDSSASKAMINILLDQQFNEVIPAGLPATVKVAHKTGSITGVQHDSGIVFLPDGRKYVLVLLSKNLTNEEAGIKAMANVSKLIYDYVMVNGQ